MTLLSSNLKEEFSLNPETFTVNTYNLLPAWNTWKDKNDLGINNIANYLIKFLYDRDLLHELTSLKLKPRFSKVQMDLFSLDGVGWRTFTESPKNKKSGNPIKAQVFLFTLI